MRAAIAGGIPGWYDPELSEKWARHRVGDYAPNPYGNFETAELTPRPEMDGHVLKYVEPAVVNIPPLAYSIAFMCRPREELLASARACKESWNVGRDEAEYRRRIQYVLVRLASRSDVVALHTIWLDDLIKEPERELGRIGWPLDLKRACGAIDEKLYHTSLFLESQTK